MYLQKNIGRKIIFAWAIALAGMPAMSNAAAPSGAEFHRAVYALLQQMVTQQSTRIEETADT